MNQVVKKRILEFLKEQQLCVISTIHAEKEGTESAVVAFAEKENLEIVFGTSNLSRKYKNIQKNPHISLVIGWSSELGSIQYEGIAKEIRVEDSSLYSELQVKKNPSSEQFVHRDDQRYFSVSPTWIRFMDFAGDSPDTYEFDKDQLENY